MLSVFALRPWTRVHVKVQSFLFPICRLQSSKTTKESFIQQSTIIPKPKTPPAVKKEVKDLQLVKDIIIYKNENPRFYKALSFFALAQLGFWMLLAKSTFDFADAPPVKSEEEEELPFWNRYNLGDTTVKTTLGSIYCLIGFGVLAVSWFYVGRSVRYLVLRKDRATVSIVTYDPISSNRIMDVPLRCISAGGSRLSEKTTMPISVQNYMFYYMIDTNGKFPQPLLFDQTVGTKRKFKK